MNIPNITTLQELSDTALEQLAAAELNPDKIVSALHQAASSGRRRAIILQDAPISLRETKTAEALKSKLVHAGYIVTYSSADETGRTNPDLFYEPMNIVW